MANNKIESPIKSRRETPDTSFSSQDSVDLSTSNSDQSIKEANQLCNNCKGKTFNLNNAICRANTAMYFEYISEKRG